MVDQADTQATLISTTHDTAERRRKLARVFEIIARAGRERIQQAETSAAEHPGQETISGIAVAQPGQTDDED